MTIRITFADPPCTRRPSFLPGGAGYRSLAFVARYGLNHSDTRVALEVLKALGRKSGVVITVREIAYKTGLSSRTVRRALDKLTEPSNNLFKKSRAGNSIRYEFAERGAHE